MSMQTQSDRHDCMSFFQFRYSNNVTVLDTVLCMDPDPDVELDENMKDK